MKARLLLVDDDTDALAGWELALLRHPYEVRTAESGVEALHILGRESIDVVVADERMPGMSGSQLLTMAKERAPNVGRIMLTGNATLDVTLRGINEAGVHRFLVKPASVEDLIEAVEAALLAVSSDGIARQLAELARRQTELLEHLGRGERDALASLSTDERTALSQREREVLKAMASGQSVKGISASLYISTHTVRNHLKSIYRKLGVHSQVELLGKLAG